MAASLLALLHGFLQVALLLELLQLALLCVWVFLAFLCHFLARVLLFVFEACANLRQHRALASGSPYASYRMVGVSGKPKITV